MIIINCRNLNRNKLLFQNKVREMFILLYISKLWYPISHKNYFRFVWWPRTYSISFKSRAVKRKKNISWVFIRSYKWETEKEILFLFHSMFARNFKNRSSTGFFRFDCSAFWNGELFFPVFWNSVIWKTISFYFILKHFYFLRQEEQFDVIWSRRFRIKIGITVKVVVIHIFLFQENACAENCHVIFLRIQMLCKSEESKKKKH